MINTYNRGFGLARGLESLITDIMDTEFYPHVWSHCSSRSAHITKEDDKYLLEVDVPGHNKKTLDIKVLDGVLRVLSLKDDKKELCQTALDKSVDIDKITAKTEDGILYVTLPKSKKSSGKVIEVA
jgi:HSP20 family molecular chaperone IbpA